jgi:hypothetical protein
LDKFYASEKAPGKESLLTQGMKDYMEGLKKAGVKLRSAGEATEFSRSEMKAPLEEEHLQAPPYPQFGEPGFPWPQGEFAERAKLGGFTMPTYRGLRASNYPETFPSASQLPSKFAREAVAQWEPQARTSRAKEMYTSTSPEVGDMYAAWTGIHPSESEIEKYWKASGGFHQPLLVNPEQYHVVDARGRSWSEVNPDAISDAKAGGHPGVIIKNVYDEPESTKVLGRPTNVVVTFPHGQKTLRSPWAQFDPSKFNMEDYLAGLGGAGFIGSAAAGGAGAQRQ